MPPQRPPQVTGYKPPRTPGDIELPMGPGDVRDPLLTVPTVGSQEWLAQQRDPLYQERQAYSPMVNPNPDPMEFRAPTTMLSDTMRKKIVGGLKGGV